MGPYMSKPQVTPQTPSWPLQQGCWVYAQGLTPNGLDCNCHKTMPMLCNPGPPPIPESMAEWMGRPPPDRPPSPAKDVPPYGDGVPVPNPYPILDKETLALRDLSVYMTELEPGLNDTRENAMLDRRGDVTVPEAVKHWVPVPFNGFAPPIEALMPDEIGHESFIRTFNYNRRLQSIGFQNDTVHRSVWNTTRHLPFKPQLTLYRLWSDNSTYIADWDPRVMIHVLSSNIMFQTNVPQHVDDLDVIFKLMPARHIYALQHCAMKSAETLANSASRRLYELHKRIDDPRNLRDARHISVWMAWTMEFYQLWKDITGLDAARKQRLSRRAREMADDNSGAHMRRNAEPNAPGQNDDFMASPWFTSPYVNQTREKLPSLAKPRPRPGKISMGKFGEVISWDALCDDVYHAAFSWRTNRPGENQPDFKEALKMFDILEPRLRDLGHGARLDRMKALYSWKFVWAGEEFMKNLDICTWFEDMTFCVETVNAIDVLLTAIRQQIAPAL